MCFSVVSSDVACVRKHLWRAVTRDSRKCAVVRLPLPRHLPSWERGGHERPRQELSPVGAQVLPNIPDRRPFGPEEDARSGGKLPRQAGQTPDPVGT